MSAISEKVKAIVFDTFGTVVDWRGSIIADLGGWGRPQSIHIDWAQFADKWRDRYNPQKARVRSGELPWTNLDELHRESLRDTLAEMKVDGLSAEQIEHINKVWHRLNGWRDSVPGLARLKTRFIIGPLSNGNVALLVNMAKHAGLPWDHCFSVELFRHYKPDPETYLGVVRMLCLEPHRVMMCAAHNYDLAAARECGLSTAFIPRPAEFGPHQTTDLEPEQDWDVIARDMNDLASQFGA